MKVITLPHASSLAKSDPLRARLRDALCEAMMQFAVASMLSGKGAASVVNTAVEEAFLLGAISLDQNTPQFSAKFELKDRDSDDIGFAAEITANVTQQVDIEAARNQLTLPFDPSNN